VRGTTLADAFHAYAIAVRLGRACAGGYAYPYCFEEAPAYIARAPGGAPALQASVASAAAGSPAAPCGRVATG
jgi:hypothetical protein